MEGPRKMHQAATKYQTSLWNANLHTCEYMWTCICAWQKNFADVRPWQRSFTMLYTYHIVGKEYMYRRRHSNTMATHVHLKEELCGRKALAALRYAEAAPLLICRNLCAHSDRRDYSVCVLESTAVRVYMHIRQEYFKGLEMHLHTTSGTFWLLVDKPMHAWRIPDACQYSSWSSA